ncbi:hypothetical protein ET445_06470 [Agromyces protaetiae]|uniref:DUF7144 domain-containing protein n=1 Tax=Agromyces protaetiae TaxID=2509455 RepID=A0A4P6FDH9_9MICO|nr:hypothetical protein [Agromyces protaetiae]QAY73043.1 hypothetical protein ET445_06470 [Agromyces protaetiae]
MAAPRPAGVTIVAVFAWISGALDILAGTLMLVFSPVKAIVDEYGNLGTLIAAGIGSIIIGLLTVIVAGGLLRGNAAARMIVTILQVLSILGSLFLAIAYASSPTAVGEWFGILISVIVLIFLWSRRANEFFRS